MKKLFYLICIFSIFLFSSCLSLSDLFKKNKDKNSVEAPVVSENIETNEKVGEPEELELKHYDFDPVKNAPEPFEEPLVRDLLIEDDIIPSLPVKEAETTTPVLVTNNSDQKFEDYLEIEPAKAVTTTTQKVEPKTTVIRNTESTTSVATSSTGSAEAPKTAAPTPRSAAATSTSTTSSVPKTTTPTATTANAGTASGSQPATTITENKAEETVANTENKAATPVTNELPFNITGIETEADIIAAQANEETSLTGDEDYVTVNSTADEYEKTIVPPVTSAGTKTNAPESNIPAAPVSRPAETTQGTVSSSKTNTTPSTNYPQKPESGSTEENTGNTSSDEAKNFSRSVTLNKGETLIVEYPGSGWIYLGSDDEYNNLESKGRKSGNSKTTYTLSAKEPGTQIQHFYKTDSLTGNYIDDYLEVTVRDVKGSSSIEVMAPPYEEIVPHKPESPALASDKIKPSSSSIDPSRGTAVVTPKIPSDPTPKEPKTGEKQSFEYIVEIPEESDNADYIETATPLTEKAVVEDFEADDLLAQAQKLYSEKKYADALKTINAFFEYAVNNRDKGLYLRGQILEADSTVKNIKEAINSYDNLVKNYPTSELWDEANKRIIYLKRFYLEAR